MKKFIYKPAIAFLFLTVALFIHSCTETCDNGYTGVDCSEQITPSIIQISKIVITDFPQYSTGENWDLLDGPDVYIVIEKDDILIHKQPTFFEDASADNHVYSPANSIELTDAESIYTISLYDYDDGLGDDFMGVAAFYAYSEFNDFPKTLLIGEGEEITFELTLSYVW